jgi:hypothetical protein
MTTRSPALAFAAVAFLLLIASAHAGPTTAPEKSCRVVINARYEGLDKPPAGVDRLVGRLLTAAGYRAVPASQPGADATLTLDLAGKLRSRSYDEYEDTGVVP